MNYYQDYYQGKKWKVPAGQQVSRELQYYITAKNAMSEKQKLMHKCLLEFFESHGFKTDIYKRPRSFSDLKQKWNAMFRILKKNGLYDEFQEYYGSKQEVSE